MLLASKIKTAAIILASLTSLSMVASIILLTFYPQHAMDLFDSLGWLYTPGSVPVQNPSTPIDVSSPGYIQVALLGGLFMAIGHRLGKSSK